MMMMMMIYIYINVYTYLCICVCAFVFVNIDLIDCQYERNVHWQYNSLFANHSTFYPHCCGTTWYKMRNDSACTVPQSIYPAPFCIPLYIHTHQLKLTRSRMSSVLTGSPFDDFIGSQSSPTSARTWPFISYSLHLLL